MLLFGQYSSSTTLAPPSTNQVAWFRFNLGQTVSQWTDQSGNANHLLQASAGNQPTLASGIYTFNGTTQFMTCAPFTLNQPITVYLRARQISWVNNTYIFDGNTVNVMALVPTSASPTIGQYSGGFANLDSDWLVDSNFYSVATVWSGASSLIKVGSNAAVSGQNPGTNAAGGFALAAKIDGSGGANIAVKEVIIYSVAHDATTIASVISYLNTL